jgi:hypothetical protein
MEPVDVVNLAMAETKNDLLDILAKIDVRRKEAAAEAQEAQMQQIQQATAMQSEQVQAERDFKMALKKMELDAADLRSQRDSEKFRIAADVDSDGKSDLLEAKMLEIAQREKEHEDKMELARQENAETQVSARI